MAKLFINSLCLFWTSYNHSFPNNLATNIILNIQQMNFPARNVFFFFSKLESTLQCSNSASTFSVFERLHFPHGWTIDCWSLTSNVLATHVVFSMQVSNVFKLFSSCKLSCVFCYFDGQVTQGSDEQWRPY